MDVLAGNQASLWVDFIHPTGMLIPDPNSVTHSIYDQTGAALLTNEPLVPLDNATGVTVVVAAGLNSITAPRRFEKRLVIVSWTSNGQSYTTRVSYRIIPMVLYTATAADVRAFIGLTEDELPDAEIDLFNAFMKVETAQLTEALSSGTLREIAANDVIKLQAVIDVLPSAKLRTTHALTNGPVRAERYRTAPDWMRIEADARAQLAYAQSVITNVRATNTRMIQLSFPDDPITGA